jgi:hypothetical protein
MKGAAYVVWPEGRPDRAVTRRTWLGMQWAMLGPGAMLAGLRGLRMSRAWPVYEAEWDIPAHVARRSERAIARLRRKRT